MFSINSLYLSILLTQNFFFFVYIFPQVASPLVEPFVNSGESAISAAGKQAKNSLQLVVAPPEQLRGLAVKRPFRQHRPLSPLAISDAGKQAKNPLHIHPNPEPLITSGGTIMKIDGEEYWITDIVSKKLFSPTLISELGKGTTATVYKASEPNTGELIAVKVFNRGFAEEYMSMIYREYEILASLGRTRGPIFRGGPNGEISIPSELFQGPTLREELSKLSNAQEKTTLIDLARKELESLHDMGWIHFDSHPGNFIVTSHLDDSDGSVVKSVHLVDFGSAKRMKGSPALDQGSMTRDFNLLDNQWLGAQN